MASTSTAVSHQQREAFATEGYVVLPDLIGAEELAMLRREADAAVAAIDAQMDAAGTDTLGINHRGSRYFAANNLGRSEELRRFVFGETLEPLCRAFLGDDVWFFLEQFVVKVAESGMQFSWHQDSGYLKQMLPSHERPYLTCWCALDDMTVENGTIWVLPFSRGIYSGITPHHQDPTTNDWVGYEGDDPGDPVEVPAGTVVAFSTHLLHRSGPNTTGKPRRGYVVQFSAEPIMRADGSGPVNMAEPHIRGGVRVS